MDLSSLVWFLGVCLAAQRHNTSGLSQHLGADGSGQGAHESVVHVDMGKVAYAGAQVWQDSQRAWDRVLGEMRTRDAVEWLVAEELRGQHVLAALAQEMGTTDAKETFKRIFFRKDSPYSASGEESMYGLAGIANGGTMIGGGGDTRTSGNLVGALKYPLLYSNQ